MFKNLTVKLSALCNSSVTIACFSSEFIFTFLCADSSIKNASKQFVSCIDLSFRKHCPSSKPTDKNLKHLVLEFQTSLSRQPFIIMHKFIWNYLFTMTDTVTSKNIKLPSWITQCILLVIAMNKGTVRHLNLIQLSTSK